MTTKDYDVVIVGSGAGGGAVAAELAPLARQGARIAVLEWGGRFRAEDNTRRELEMARKYYFDSGGFQTASQDMTIAIARAVGGSTTVYTGTSLRAPARVFEHWGVKGITVGDLAPRYAKYERQNGVHLLPPGEINENNRLFAEGCRRLGWKVEQFPINTRGCGGLGTCNLGCARLAKQGTAQVQLPEAEKAGIEIVPFCRVDRVGEGEVDAEVIAPEHGLGASPWQPGRYRLRARRIVLAAGAIHTPALLLKSFGPRWPALGRYFTCHPALILAAIHGRQVRGPEGHPKSYFCEQFAESRGFLLETCMYYPFTLAKNLAGFGEEMEEVVASFERLQMILVLAADEAEPNNRVTVDGQGRPRVHYGFADRTIDALVEAMRASARIFFAAGAEKVHAPAADRFLIRREESDAVDRIIDRRHFQLGRVSISSAHPMGGCRMGDDPATSVADAWGRVHGLKGVCVADASLFPSSSKVNPYLTVMALADRVAEAVLKDFS